jgi:hypothetical protein
MGGCQVCAAILQQKPRVSFLHQQFVLSRSTIGAALGEVPSSQGSPRTGLSTPKHAGANLASVLLPHFLADLASLHEHFPPPFHRHRGVQLQA